jgi:ribonuclease HI
MGYDFHITRREDWYDKGDDISTDEWLSYVESDPELSIDETNGEYFANWKDDDWLDWRRGEIYTKNPRKKLVEKMIQIANRLSAKVQGDEGEVYTDTSQVSDDEEVELLLQRLSSARKQSWWRRIWGE